MSKIFNVSGDCKPKIHYMVNIDERLMQIKAMVDQGQYFTINRARQYGKTTTLHALEHFLENEYTVISLDFQIFSTEDFKSEQDFIRRFSAEILDSVDHEGIPEDILIQLDGMTDGGAQNEKYCMDKGRLSDGRALIADRREYVV